MVKTRPYINTGGIKFKGKLTPGNGGNKYSFMGQGIQQEWHYQFRGDNGNVEILADKVNDLFLSITENFPPLSPFCPNQHVPNEFFVSEAEVYRSLSSLQVAKSVGPDELPNRVLKEFATELSPAIQDIYNQPIKEAYIPLKSSIISPIPKVTPPQSIESDLRPISLTCNLAKIMEGFFCRRLLSQLTRKIDPGQFVRKGHSTMDALLFLLQMLVLVSFLLTLAKGSTVLTTMFSCRS